MIVLKRLIQLALQMWASFIRARILHPSAKSQKAFFWIRHRRARTIYTADYRVHALWEAPDLTKCLDHLSWDIPCLWCVWLTWLIWICLEGLPNSHCMPKLTPLGSLSYSFVTSRSACRDIEGFLRLPFPPHANDSWTLFSLNGISDWTRFWV